ncbi:transporter [Stenotrophomonas panacihumi]|uniref:Transporter n=1 Tax=Stenotrophomonas panacihumi TaxID=676599 RepID=A0A0R0AEC2_9GAMM|nr:AEC family transporter [Stenotrophomonas panacihumi]KRG43371.1 transporter [Stenotrophomonas panacihumi]PTN55060.1 AEC family transporter [Stenotrophomonas panacihumi]
MLSLLAIVLPIFALILAGWLARRTGALGPHATGELNRYVVYLALPALLFDVVANAHWAELWQPDFIGAFGLGAAVVFVGTVLLRLRRRPLADAAIDGLNAGYANTGFIGFPLAAALYGQGALPATLVATILTVCVLFAIALVLIETGLQEERHPRRMLASIGGRLARNPLLVAPVLGALVLLAGQQVPTPVESFLKLLGASASPCALVALGLFLAEPRTMQASARRTVAGLVALKLVAQPLLTWALATQLFHLPPPQAHVAVLLAALPTGTGPFMVAEFYRREASVTSSVVLASTVLSLLTLTAYLACVH